MLHYCLSFLIFVLLFFIFFFFFFFFQAEDGIRDWSVTGVQTCALPISVGAAPGRARLRRPSRGPSPRLRTAGRVARTCPTRSEERRVGKECRYRWSPYQ